MHYKLTRGGTRADQRKHSGGPAVADTPAEVDTGGRLWMVANRDGVLAYCQATTAR